MVKPKKVADKNTPPPVYGGRLGGGPHTARDRGAQKHARALRQNVTDAEKALWTLLRRKQMGARFRRQYPVGPYIADFACLKPPMIVEVDGGQHAVDIARDEKRTRFLHAAGFRVLRFWNNEILQNPEGVYSVIMETLMQAPSPTLPRKQGREKDASSPERNRENT